MYKKILFFSTFCLVSAVLFYNHSFQHKIDHQDAIKNIMAFPMTDIVKRCKKDHHYSDEDMVILERELKRYLALSLIEDKKSKGTGMYSADVDNLWHTFILFTKEYTEFCNTYFGHYLHHVPELDTIHTQDRHEEIANDFELFAAHYEKFYSEELHPIWFLDMCNTKSVDSPSTVA